MATVNIELKVTRAEHDTVAKRPGSFGNDLQGVDAIISADLHDRLNRVVCLGTDGVPVLEELAIVIGDHARNDFLNAKALHDVVLRVPCLAHLNVTTILSDLKLMLAHGIEDRDVALLQSIANLSPVFGTSCLNHLWSV